MSEVTEAPVAESTSVAVPEAEPAPLVAAPPLADCSAAEQAERRYLSVINPLFAEAYEQRHTEAFVDVLTWTLARVIVGLDKPWVTGDILRRIGNYSCRIAESNRAQAEAKAAKEEGRLPH